MEPPTTPPSELTVLITAHPDDESMFFVPTLHSLTSSASSSSSSSSSSSQPLQQVWLLCLTTGNYGGLGKVRSKELKCAAEQILRVDKTILLDDPRFPDNPVAAWDPGFVASAIQKALS